MTFSQSDYYKVNEIGYLTYFSYFCKSNTSFVFKPLLFDFCKVERVLCSSFCFSTFLKSNEFCVQAFAVRLL